MAALISKPRAIWYSCDATNAALVTDFGVLDDGQTDSVCRFQFTNVDSPGGPIQIRLRNKMTSPIAQGVAVVPRFAGVVGGTLPVGMPIKFFFRQDGQTGFAYQPAGTPIAPMTAKPHGGTAGWSIIPDSGVACSGMMIQIDNPGTFFTVGQYFDIGDVFMADGADFRVKPDIAIKVDDNTNRRYTRYRQSQPYPGVPRRIIPFTPTPMSAASALILDKAFASISKGAIAALCIKSTIAKVYDAATANEHTYFGDLVQQPDLVLKLAKNSEFGQGQFIETPIPV